ncbi:MAG: long-chain fatty acid--CoA ligase [Gammaproteobacteria bacterium]|nr:long-chain fatty acid--CoA ligase [Gammaproteobacteria bacterium]
MVQLHENLISLDEAVTLDGLFVCRVRRSPDREAYRFFDKDADDWRSYSWSQMAHEVARWQAAMRSEGAPRGGRVAIQLRNCPEWVMFDQAALGLGLVNVPLYTDDRPDNIAYILNEADVNILLVQDAGRWRRLADVVGDEGPLKRVLLLDDSAAARELAAEDERVRIVSDWLPDAGGALQRRDGADAHALASIVYTSGTTGRPKGVMLSHHNMLSVAHGGLTLLDCYEEDVFLSFLPLSHTLERTAGYYLCIMTGSCVAYARSVAQLAADLQTVRPSVLVAVPRIFERVYGRIADQMNDKGGLAKRLFEITVNIGWRRFLHQQGRGRWPLGSLLWPLLQRLVASKITSKLGGNIRAAISGGAALNEEIARVFIGLGVPIVQGYGLTETAPIVSANPLEDNIPSSVGVPIRGVQVRIGDNDELLVKSPGMMLGYWNNHAATAQVIDPEGWLHTGDQARIDASNHIYITGRIKDILVLSNGEKIPPGDMESAIALDPLFEQVMVVGEGRPYLTALIVVDGDHWSGFAQQQGLDPLDPASLDHPKVKAAAARRVKAALKDFPGYAKIRQLHLSLEPWTVEDGLITPTLKVKRMQVLARYQGDVEAMYTGGPAG